LAPFLVLIVAEGLSVLVQQAIQNGLFESFLVGKDNVEVSHLQFVDDTLLVGSGGINHIHTMKVVLCFFELVLGLSINFVKIQLVGVAIEESMLGTYAKMLNCKIFKVPFTYLGIPVGNNLRRSSTWHS